MRKFQFRLQTVLDQRKSREDRLQIELGEIKREEAREAARLAHLQRRLIEAGALIIQALMRNLPGDELERRDEYAKATRDDIKVQQLTLQAVRERVEAKRVELVEAIKERKVLEAFRDKQEWTYVQACARAEQNELDAMASVRYAREM